MPQPPKKKKSGMFIYCEASEKERLQRVLRRQRATLSGYVMNAVMAKVESDERKFGLSLNPA